MGRPDLDLSPVSGCSASDLLCEGGDSTSSWEKLVGDKNYGQVGTDAHGPKLAESWNDLGSKGRQRGFTSYNAIIVKE